MNQQALSSFIWSVADLLRGDYKQADYGKVILPFTVIRRLDCVLADTKEKVLKRASELRGRDIKNPELSPQKIPGVPSHNVSKLAFARRKDCPSATQSPV